MVALYRYPRIHLRIESDGSGLLLVDVTDAIHLNATAALLSKLALDGVPLPRAVRILTQRFRGAPRHQMQREAEQVYAMISRLVAVLLAPSDRNGDRPCPTCGLDWPLRAAPFSLPVQAPYKADIALTYGCNNACRHCYNEPARAGIKSLAPDEWRRVLEKLAQAGVPHVIFTGGEPTLVPELPALIRHASRLGLVTGVNTNGRRLADPSFAHALAESGLSHVQITLHSCRPEVHNAVTGAVSFKETVAGIRRALEFGLHTITNTTLTRRSVPCIEQLVDFLYGLGLRIFAANGMIYAGRGRNGPDALAEPELGPVLVGLRDRAAELGMRFLWYTPTAWCRLSPMEFDLGPRRCNAAEYSLCVEPNGDVLPCQSFYEPAGNILRDPWEAIWQSPLFRSFRQRVADPQTAGLAQACWDCPDLALCAGGCPLERRRKAENGKRKAEGASQSAICE